MRIEHAALYVNDLEGARLFFERYLGAKAGNLYHNARTGFRSYFLSFDDGAHIGSGNNPQDEIFARCFEPERLGGIQGG